MMPEASKTEKAAGVSRAAVGEAPERGPEPVLVSACLLGRQCRYDGRANRDALLSQELERAGRVAVPFCPEEHGGLGTPRPPAWIDAGGAEAVAEAVLDGMGRVVTDAGVDVTRAFRAGAEGALAVCRTHGIRRAFLKERSPSCGVCATHAAGALVPGPGVTAALLMRNGIAVVGVEGRRG